MAANRRATIKAHQGKLMKSLSVSCGHIISETFTQIARCMRKPLGKSSFIELQMHVQYNTHSQ